MLKNHRESIEKTSAAFSDIHDLELAVLVGSQASGAGRSGSDWDIAIQWDKKLNFIDQLAATESLRKCLATTLNIDILTVDLIDLPTARLAMRAVVAEEGQILHGAETLAWCHFLQRTWRELEEAYWEEIYAA